MGKKIEILNMSSSPIRIQKFVDHNSRGHIHWHEEIEILYFESGEATLICNLREHRVKGGDIVFVNGNELHTGSFGGSKSVYYCIHVNSDFFHNSLSNEYAIFSTVISDVECADILRDIISRRDGKGFAESLYIRKRMLDFFLLLHNKGLCSVIDESEYKKRFKRLDTLNEIIGYIDANYTEALNISMLADRFYMSESYFSHFFKKRVGKSVIEYINEIRIRNAKRILEMEDLSISDVAGAVGFSDINYFSRKFKAIAGVTPSEYRKQFS